MIRRTVAGINVALGFSAATILLGCIPAGEVKTGSQPVSTSGTIAESRASGEPGDAGTAAQPIPARLAAAQSDRDRSDSYDLSAAEQRMREQSRNFDRTVWEGTLIGAAGGAVWGLIGGGDTSDMVREVAMGATVGGLSGAYMARKKKQYADKEDQLEAMILDVRESSEDAEAFIASVQEVVAEDRRRLVAVEKRFQQGLAAQQELRREKERVGSNRAVVVKAVEGARQKYRMFEGARKDYEDLNPGTDTQRFRQELKTYDKHIETLDELAESIGGA